MLMVNRLLGSGWADGKQLSTGGGTVPIRGWTIVQVGELVCRSISSFKVILVACGGL